MSERCSFPNSDQSKAILEGNGQMERLGDSGLPARGDGGKIQSNCSNVSDKHDGERRTLMEVLTDFPKTRIFHSGVASSTIPVVLKRTNPPIHSLNQPRPPYLLRCKYHLVHQSSSNGFIQCNQCSIFQMQYGSYNRYDLALDHAISHMERPIFPCLTCNTAYPTVAALSYHLREVHGAKKKDVFDFPYIMDQHCQEILNMIDQCFGPKKMPQERIREAASTMVRTSLYPVVLKRLNPPIQNEATSTMARTSSDPVVFKRPNPPIQSEIDNHDTVWKYLKSKLITTYKPGSIVRCSICWCNLGHQQHVHHSEKITSAAYVHMFTHTDIFPFMCNYCQHGGKSASDMLEHVKSAHPECAASMCPMNRRRASTSVFTDNTLPYKSELTELVDICYSKNGPSKEPPAKQRRLLETATMSNKIDSGVSLIPSTYQGLALVYGGSVSSADQASSENDQESKIHPMTITRQLGSGISSEIASNANSSIVSGNGCSSGWNALIKCEVVDSTPVLIPTNQWVLKEPKKEEPEFDLLQNW